LESLGVIDQDGEGSDERTICDDILNDIRRIERVGIINFQAGIHFLDGTPLKESLLLNWVQGRLN
jgi:hypothetical protein